MDQSFIISDLDFTESLNENRSSVSEIKTEEEKADDVLFFSHLDQFRPNTSDYSALQDRDDNESSLVFPETIGATDFRGVLNNSNFANDNKHGAMKMEGGLHFVKYRMFDGKQVKFWSCGICAKEFGHQYTLMRHLPTHTDERKFQCNTCGKAFRQMSTLSQHRAIHSSERPYICEVCQKTFNRVSTLISHRKTHTGLKPHRCHLCNKAFHQKGNLRNHIFTHTNERPYKCDICEKGFNQMSNLMCHKLKAHQRADKPKYICQICGQDFPRRIGLRNHEQHQHGLNQNVTQKLTQEKLKYSNAIIVDPIRTDAMKLAMQSNQTPFALLRPLAGIPVLVRVIPAGDKQMLIPATADDLKKHGQISIIPKVSTGGSEITESKPGSSSVGSTVQIRIPVVATVIQQNGRDGLSMSIVSPGPNGEVVNKQECTSTENNSFVYTSTLTSSASRQAQISPSADLDGTKQNGFYDHTKLVENAEIEFLDQAGNMISEEDFRHNFSTIPTTTLYPNNDVFPVSDCMSSEPVLNSDACISMESIDTSEEDSSQFLMPWNF